MANKELSIYQKIRNDIINGDLTQNEKITESKLAQRYNVSRTPIREAIKQLELEYFIRDGYIYVPTVEEYRNIFEMRILIETHAIKKASIVFTQDDIEELKSYATIGDDKTEEEIIQINDQFHQKIMSATTDDRASITYDREQQPGITNLLELLALLTGRDQAQVNAEWEGKERYGEFKQVDFI